MSNTSLPKVFFLGIDGCRPDALARAHTPTLDRLIAEGAFTDEATTCEHSNSGSCWASLLTGVWESRHGILDNSCLGARIDEYPTIFGRLRKAYPEKRAAAVVHWTTRHHPILEGVDHYRWQNNDEGVAQVAMEWLDQEAPDLLFALLNEVDDAGHEHGFDPVAPGYLAAISAADHLVERILSNLARRRALNGENWLLVVTTDHGGIGFSHGGDTREERRVFLLFHGDSVDARRLPTGLTVVDVAPTLLKHLGGSTVHQHELDGNTITLENTQC